MIPRLKASGVSKNFPGVRALDNVPIEIAPGEVHALLGENGAGKSTLGKIIGGVYMRDAGMIELDGKLLTVADEAQAGKQGIVIVHQEGSLVRQLSIADNIFAGRTPAGFLGRINQSLINERSTALLGQLGSDLDPRRKVAELSSAQMQIVEIAKALSQDLKLLVLDEPTAALTLTETDKLFEVIRKLTATGVSVIYVSHRLAEIFAVCDRVSVLKDGKLTGVRNVKDTTTDELIRLMVGREVHLARDENRGPRGDVQLSVRNLGAKTFVRDVSFDVHAGEMVCLAGLVGSGRSETCEVIFGAREKTAGEIRVADTEVDFAGPWDAMAAGLGMVPEDRKDVGLFLGMDIARNISVTVMKRLSPRGVFDERLAVSLADEFIGKLRIATPSALRVVGDLSGGNQQKVLIAKWLAMNPKILIVDEPTRGVDVGARSEIYRILRELSSKGMALLIVSSDLPEVLALADRIVVMADGRSVGELDGRTATEEDVLRLATRFTQTANAPGVGVAA